MLYLCMLSLLPTLAGLSSLRITFQPTFWRLPKFSFLGFQALLTHPYMLHWPYFCFWRHVIISSLRTRIYLCWMLNSSPLITSLLKQTFSSTVESSCWTGWALPFLIFCVHLPLPQGMCHSDYMNAWDFCLYFSKIISRWRQVDVIFCGS